MTAPAFSLRPLAGWIGAAAMVLVGSLYFMQQPQSSFYGDPVGPTTFSRSAIGHAGIADVLRRLGIRVVKSQSDTAAKLGAGSVLVLAEPPSSIPQAARRVMLSARTTLLVLPKRFGRASRTQPGFVEHVDLVPESTASAVVKVVDPAAEVVRADALGAVSVNRLAVLPQPAGPVQLLRSAKLRPVVATANGMLVGELSESGGARPRRVWVLSDPDLIANHGIAEPANAAFAVALFDALRGNDGNVVFDETIHGFAVVHSDNPLRFLFQFPFSITAVLGVIALALVLWAGSARFGTPLKPAPALRFGKQDLIENTARLMEFAGHQRIMTLRYTEAVLRELGGRLHAPRGLSNEALATWLARIGSARGVAPQTAAVLDRLDGLSGARDLRSLAAVARDLHRFKGEIIDGASGHPRPHGRRAGRDPKGGGGAG
jgi:hypothetical protein